ncbi:uncharacterized protein LOC110700632 isoform X2 [Chenopodium quinoa]|uniref:uncharacterized protein LOC110700632 isoform X2 n=1 Tax=Chenopodium quinoa TaxID=63459 RepID=UPI000B79A539|nr:uncharacterized protein LOC110700632 isoform X2 [Chenopodium quinoa]
MGKDDEIPSSSSSSDYYPVLGVNNIKNVFPLILDREKVQYSNWVELFECHTHAYNVLDHIDPKTTKSTDISDEMWKRLNSIVKNWIYSTISKDLLETVIEKGVAAQQIWDKLKAIFQDNKTTRAVYLENQFNALHLSKFSDISSYCRELKNIKDQLANVYQPVSEQKMVIRLVSGLVNTDFDTVAARYNKRTLFPHSKLHVLVCYLKNPDVLMTPLLKPLPSWLRPQIRLLLEQPPHPRPSSRTHQTAGVAAPVVGARPRPWPGRGRGRGTAQQQQQQPQPQQQKQAPSWGNQSWASNNQTQSHAPQWGFAPCLYPQQWAPPRPGFMAQQQSRPPQAYFSGPYPQQQQQFQPQGSEYGSAMTPTELGNSFATMSLQNYDPSWYMDSGATSHMTNNVGSTNGETNNQMQ